MKIFSKLPLLLPSSFFILNVDTDTTHTRQLQLFSSENLRKNSLKNSKSTNKYINTQLARRYLISN